MSIVENLKNEHFERLDEALKRKSWIRFPHYLYTYFLTVNGKIFLGTITFSAPISFVALNTTVYMFLTSGISLLIISFILGFISKPKVSIKSNIPQLVEAKSVIDIDVFIKNKKKKSIYQIKAFHGFQTSFIEYLDSEDIFIIKGLEKRIYTEKIIFNRRGVYFSDHLFVSSSFPFNLFNFANILKEKSKITVFPHYERFETFDLEINHQFQSGVISFISNIGESTEFIGTREYVYGDNPRFIHSQSWARTGKPVIKEFQEEFFVRFALIIDTFCLKSESFENSLSFAASISDYLSRSNYVIDIFSAGHDFYHFQSGRALENFENILELLACINSSKLKKDKVSDNFKQITSNLENHINNISGLIFIFNDWDKEREKMINLFLTYGVGIKAYVFSDKKNIKIPDELKKIVSLN